MAFVQLPLGTPIPNSPHAVSASLPTMRDVRGYEEKNPETMRAVHSAYPRFVVHPAAAQLGQHIAATAPGFTGRKVWLTSSRRMANALADQLRRDATLSALVRTDVRAFEFQGISGVAHPVSAEITTAAKTFLQNVGGFISSREAEDCLVRFGLVTQAQPESLFAGDATAEIHRVLRRALPACSDADLVLTNSGMNAIYAAFQASSALQSARGRTVWIQLGWLYRDTIAVLQRFSGTADYVYIRDALDLDTLKRVFARFGSRVAGIVAELPTNPLIQMPDVAVVSALCREHGAHLIVDPSVVSIFAVNVLEHADVVVTSLTKYTASEGDVIAGAIAINPRGRDAAGLRTRCAEGVEGLYGRDAARLASEIGETEAVLAKIDANAARVTAFLEHHPKVREVFWPLHPASRANFTRVAQRPDTTGGMISFTLCGPIESFYDALRLPKGPSFGMKTTLICPFIYLAHYDLVSTPAGIAELGASQLDPELLRLCVGTEPAEEIIAAISEALG